MRSVAEACAAVVALARPLLAERVPLGDALGLVLAEDAYATHEHPPWDNSAMDGYAVHAEDVAGASRESPVELPVEGTIAAGSGAPSPLARGAAMRIMTGAPLPEGADTVIRVEDTDGGLARVLVRNARDSRRNVRPRGEDFRSGQVVIPAGSVIGAAQIGVLATLGIAEPVVHRRPVVAFLASGDELVPVERFEDARSGTRIVSSNSYTLNSAMRAAGATPLDLGIAADDPADLRSRVERAIDENADVVITSGGISVGAFDHTRAVLEALGARLEFWRVRMRPGGPFGAGVLAGRPWLGLPGNPVSSMVTFELFARPLIRRMLGHERLYRKPVEVVLEHDVEQSAPLTHFFRATLSPRADGRTGARLTGPQGSGLLTSMARADALLILPLERARAGAGDTLLALPLGDDSSLSAAWLV